MRIEGPGGTSGGLGEFLIGFAMAVAGGYMITSQVTVSSGFAYLWGYNSFGLSLLPMLGGIGLLFFNGRSTLGWILLFAGLIIIFAGVLLNMQVYFHSTSLFGTVMMFGLLAGGLGLVARSLRSR